MLIDYYKPTHQPTQQIYQLTYFLVNIYFCYCFFAYLFSCIVIFYVAYSFIYIHILWTIVTADQNKTCEFLCLEKLYETTHSHFVVL